MAGLLPETAERKRMATMPSKTWRLDPDTGRVRGWIDGEEALQQAVLLRLSTPRYEHVIYSFDYGSELEGLIGKDGGYAMAAAPALAEECLLRDDRIRAVSRMEVSRKGEALAMAFTVVTEDGAYSGEAEVSG